MRILQTWPENNFWSTGCISRRLKYFPKIHRQDLTIALFYWLYQMVSKLVFTLLILNRQNAYFFATKNFTTPKYDIFCLLPSRSQNQAFSSESVPLTLGTEWLSAYLRTRFWVIPIVEFLDRVDALGNLCHQRWPPWWFRWFLQKPSMVSFFRRLIWYVSIEIA